MALFCAEVICLPRWMLAFACDDAEDGVGRCRYSQRTRFAPSQHAGEEGERE